MSEAPLVERDGGVVPEGEGWFVVNVADSPWYGNDDFGAANDFEGDDARFADYGLHLHVLWPGQPNCMYHHEPSQEDFLVLAGECLVLIEEQERRLKAWDFVHCPGGTTHVFVGAGDGPCLILMIGGKQPDGSYPVSELALRHRAGVEQETEQPSEAYATHAKWKQAPLPADAGLPWQ